MSDERLATDIRPRRDWVLVLQEPRKELVGHIFLPSDTGIEKVTESSGHIVRLGPGIKAEKLELKVGDRIIFRGYLKYANPVDHDERWGDGSKKEYFLMSLDDVFAVVPEDLNVGAFSGLSNPEIS